MFGQIQIIGNLYLEYILLNCKNRSEMRRNFENIPKEKKEKFKKSENTNEKFNF